MLPFDKPEIRDYLYADVVKWLDDQVNGKALRRKSDELHCDCDALDPRNRGEEEGCDSPQGRICRDSLLTLYPNTT